MKSGARTVINRVHIGVQLYMLNYNKTLGKKYLTLFKHYKNQTDVFNCINTGCKFW